jgi:predicted nuclease of predicted toxin-antitoxin system
MWERYDPRSSNDRDRDEFGDRRGSRGGSCERDHAADRDPRDVFTKDLDLPRGRERRPVRNRDRVYEINGAESRMLATVGAFRVIFESDLHAGRENTRKGLRRLEREGLIRTSPLSSDDRAVVLTDRGRDLLEANRLERRAHLGAENQSVKPLDFPLLTDENVAPDVVAGLRARSCDVRTAWDEHLIGRPDVHVLEHATSQGRVVVTQHVAFGRSAIRSGTPFTGIIYLRPGHISLSSCSG